jgi:hypothetical protein
VLEGSQVDQPTERTQPRPPGDDLAVDPQPGDPAIWEDLEPHVGEPLADVDRERVPGVTLELGARQDLRPDRRGERSHIERVIHLGRVQRARLRKVAPEERGVDDDAADHARHAEPDETPVVIAPGRRVTRELRRPTTA